jgi:hypothetical protein
MYKKFFYKAVVLSSVMFILVVANNASATPITASAEVVGNIAVAQNQVLNFGQFTSSTAAGTVRLDAGTTVAVVGGGVVHLGSEQIGIADLDTSGAGAGPTITVTVTGTTLVSGLNNMTVAGNCKHATGALSADNGSCTFTSTGANPDPVDIGGVVTVGANQPVGTYTGSIEVTAAF